MDGAGTGHHREGTEAVKFILLRTPTGQRFPILFNEIQDHCDVADAMVKSGKCCYEVVDAGFCSIYIDADDQRQVTCWGQSTTLPSVKPDEKTRRESEVLIKIMTNPS